MLIGYSVKKAKTHLSSIWVLLTALLHSIAPLFQTMGDWKDSATDWPACSRLLRYSIRCSEDIQCCYQTLEHRLLIGHALILALQFLYLHCLS